MKSGRGGKRKGAGRPRLAQKKISKSIALYSEDWSYLDRVGPSRGAAVEKMISKCIKNDI